MCSHGHDTSKHVNLYNRDTLWYSWFQPQVWMILLMILFPSRNIQGEVLQLAYYLYLRSSLRSLGFVVNVWILTQMCLTLTWFSTTALQLCFPALSGCYNWEPGYATATTHPNQVIQEAKTKLLLAARNSSFVSLTHLSPSSSWHTQVAVQVVLQGCGRQVPLPCSFTSCFWPSRTPCSSHIASDM